jgi:hypothetical protein
MAIFLDYEVEIQSPLLGPGEPTGEPVSCRQVRSPLSGGPASTLENSFSLGRVIVVFGQINPNCLYEPIICRLLSKLTIWFVRVSPLTTYIRPETTVGPEMSLDKPVISSSTCVMVEAILLHGNV